MDYLPIYIKLTGRPCLVVGGGEVAARKVGTLRAAGAAVSVLAPELVASLARQAESGEITWLEQHFDRAVVADYALVVAATSDRSVNEAVSQAAKARGIPVNVVDSPELCTFIFPAIIDRSPVIAAVSSGGASPVLSRVLRMRLETLLSPAYGRLAALAENFRARVKQRLTDVGQRRRFWERVLQGRVAELVFAGREEEAAAQLQRELDEHDSDVDAMGRVALVGAGPGDPDLLTLGALRLIQEADVVVYDRLVSPEVMNLVRKDAEKIYAGKQRSLHALPQEDINRLLARLAKAGKRVVRLKGGDPFIFGRGGEEIETLMEEGVPFQVVPGITAASGCAAYAGIPLTHRDYAQSCTFVTGHLKDDSTIDLDWRRLAVPQQTVVIYMGLQGLDRICSALIEHGCPADLPAALVQQGTTRHQVVVCGNLGTLPGLVAERDIKAPTLVIIGHVVKLHEKLAWFYGERQELPGP
ncbi:siroheme synthase CysG [Methylococcus sp. EFPC2]|uniref:siroheme synthase CysG n=1 Tax=Methylococcus sp. EFPC2 TaxID=2812648 RepID=UPI00196898FA|nr:siroheme synthase CysG [Methylococcus sp. EFPC2]QSA98288.1 uroporphyrinogen-III C-methyltransferase [Methylococcus sp. EFPC2]